MKELHLNIKEIVVKANNNSSKIFFFMSMFGFSSSNAKLINAIIFTQDDAKLINLSVLRITISIIGWNACLII